MKSTLETKFKRLLSAEKITIISIQLIKIEKLVQKTVWLTQAKCLIYQENKRSTPITGIERELALYLLNNIPNKLTEEDKVETQIVTVSTESKKSKKDLIMRARKLMNEVKLPVTRKGSIIECLGYLPTPSQTPHFENYSNKKFLYPIGFQSRRRGWSSTDPFVKVEYICKIVKGSKGPMFCLVLPDGSEIKNTTPSRPWMDLMARRNVLLERQGKQLRATNMYGAEEFGLIEPQALPFLEGVEGIEHAEQYVFIEERNKQTKLPQQTANRKNKPNLMKPVNRLIFLLRRLLKSSVQRKRKLTVCVEESILKKRVKQSHHFTDSVVVTPRKVMKRKQFDDFTFDTMKNFLKKIEKKHFVKDFEIMTDSLDASVTDREIRQEIVCLYQSELSLRSVQAFQHQLDKKGKYFTVFKRCGNFCAAATCQTHFFKDCVSDIRLVFIDIVSLAVSRDIQSTGEGSSLVQVFVHWIEALTEEYCTSFKNLHFALVAKASETSEKWWERRPGFFKSRRDMNKSFSVSEPLKRLINEVSKNSLEMKMMFSHDKKSVFWVKKNNFS